MPTDSALRSMPTRGIIKNPRPPEKRETLAPIDEICTAVAETSGFVYTGDHAGYITVSARYTGIERKFKIATDDTAIRAMAIGKTRMVIAFGGWVRLAHATDILIQMPSKPVSLKQYFGTDRSSVSYPTCAAVRAIDDAVFALACGGGEVIVVNADNGELLKRVALPNNLRAMHFVKDSLRAFDEGNRKYIIKY
jgi:hypothetical protein